jgi:Fe-S-cluster-containing hydrogenase component 2
MIIVENAEACTGCLICEMACSFHHIGKFSRNQSSIKVHKSIYNQEERPQITIFYENMKGNTVCDLCNDEETPLCIQFCPESVFRLEKQA